MVADKDFMVAYKDFKTVRGTFLHEKEPAS